MAKSPDTAKEDVAAGMSVAAAVPPDKLVRIRALIDQAWHTRGSIAKGEEAEVSIEDAELLCGLGHAEKVEAGAGTGPSRSNA